MIDDVQLGVLANLMGCSVFLIIVLFHYVTAGVKEETD
jgi:hypothetical protein